ncbi:alpha-ketoglutarate-dependent dioxygenase AlkB family protein [Dokdonella fugitiva]|jgi:alkylated DNA repair dioxygenase AlkB|uniref:Alkylated DNA repair dioxygenase AlkB n=1 Tax=Dokdonella fugitiva TaxID=328517 RepID=A0A4R2HZP9_9GAMM|nr:alpha-ketoglutarate-dependent dioxygenase AlkB [Dokdonella fugitiva]MBA8884620.1 alkylated DNA repair dioxygenase AlkB [Dokdonella fugitiva]TCO37191.1 alkylated DNA repair dioxygenase AlkB [Dokdonella fugitiva]
MVATDLFGTGLPADADRLRTLDLPGADLRYAACAWPPAQADALRDALLDEIPWAPHVLRIFGRDVPTPRLSCWMGDAGAAYTYSGARFTPTPWTPTVARLRDELHERYGLAFNSVLANLYRDGRDTVGWHSDDEAELGPEPVIASLSFGAPRTFRLRARHTRTPALSIELAHGSLLVMEGATQRLYQHALPRRAGVTAPRINLTFRRITAA